MIPRVLSPGWCDPRLRSFSADANGNPPPDDLDRIALLMTTFGNADVGGASGDWSALIERDIGWSEIKVGAAPAPYGNLSAPPTYGPAKQLVAQYGANGAAQQMVLARWRRLVAAGALPEDREFEATDPEYANWPNQGDNLTRFVHFWGYDGALLHFDEPVKKLLQIQKWDGKESRWRILSKWGQDLTYEWKGDHWEAGWNLGTWLDQRKTDITTAVSIAFQALITVVSFGVGGVAVGAAVGAAQSAQTAAIEGMRKLASGDLQGAAQSFGNAGKTLAANPQIAAAFTQAGAEVSRLVQIPIISDVYGRVVSGSNSLELGRLLDTAKQIGAKLPTVTGEMVKQARMLFPTTSGGVFFDWARTAAKFGNMQALQERLYVPWYAAAPWSLGATIGAVEQQQQLNQLLPYESGEATVSFQQALMHMKQNAAAASIGPFSFAQVLLQQDPDVALDVLVSALKKRYSV